jgi:hypothetical protein
VVDHLKTQECEEKGSPVSSNDNHIALIFFMLSHYVADGHVPFHCDARPFSEGANLHAHVEEIWDDAVKRLYRIDYDNERFYYEPDGYPLRESNLEAEYQASFLKKVDDSLGNRAFNISYGGKNTNVWDFMSAVCQSSYLLSYCVIPEGNDQTNVTLQNWESLGSLKSDDISIAVLSDAIDSISRIWFRVWRRYLKWKARD